MNQVLGPHGQSAIRNVPTGTMTCVLAKARTAGKVIAMSGFVRSLCLPHGLPFWLGPCLFFTFWSGLKGESIDFKHLEASLTQVPRTFLTLAHSVEGQREMGLKPEHEAAMDRLLKEADGPCLRVRHLAPEIQRPILAKAEKQVAQAILDLLGSQALVRLRQLELQSQGVRAYVRPEVMQFMQLDATQIHDLKSLFEQKRVCSLSHLPDFASSSRIRVEKAEKRFYVAEMFSNSFPFIP